MSLDQLTEYDLRINSNGFFESYRDGVWNPSGRFNDYDLLLITFGTGSCLVNGSRHTVTPHDVILLRRGDLVEKPVTAGRLCNMFVHFDFIGPDGEAVDPPAHLLPPRFPVAGNTNLLTSLTQNILDAGQLRQSKAAVAYLKAVLLSLAGQPEGRRPDLSEVHRSRLIREVAARILVDPVPRRRVPDLAAEVGMSAVQFTRCFRRGVGYSPGEFMILARVEQARLLLSTTSRSIAEIADTLGYVDEYYFSRQFSRKEGCPPATYRRRHQALAGKG